MDLHADLVPLGDGRWRLIAADGVCCTLDDPPEAWVDDLRARCQGSRRPLAPELESALADHDLLSPEPPRVVALLIGGGLLAAEAALALAQAGVTIHVSAPDAAPVALDPMGEHSSGAAAVRAWVKQRHPRADIGLAPHWTASTPERYRLALIASDTVQPDRAITDHLVRHGLPHLVARAHHGAAVVGPLVAAPDGPCLGCLDLTLADHDPHWPATLIALTTRQARPDPAAAHWAGTQAALEGLWFLRAHGATLASSTVEIDLAHPGVMRRRWRPHPDCACRLAAPGGLPLPLGDQAPRLRVAA